MSPARYNQAIRLMRSACTADAFFNRHEEIAMSTAGAIFPRRFGIGGRKMSESEQDALLDRWRRQRSAARPSVLAVMVLLSVAVMRRPA